MRRFLGVPVVALLLAAITASSADAGYCGAARYWRCRATGCQDYVSCKQQCSTVMKTCREVVYEKQQYTCYKTCYERIVEPKTINYTKMVAETCYRQVEYTVSKPVWETCKKTVQ